MRTSIKGYWLIICTLFSLSARSQENFIDGYVVLTGNDTVRGRIDFRDWADNPRKVNFASARAGAVTTYSPHDIQSFSVNSEIFRSYRVRIYPFSLNPVVATSENWSSEPYDSTVFLRLVTGGNLSLYYYRDRKDLTYYFIQAQAGVPNELRIQSRVQESNGQQSVATDLLFRDQLTGILAGCEPAARQAGRVSYNENALRKLIFSYNTCGKDTAEVSQADAAGSSKTVSFVPMLGYIHSSVKMTGSLDEAKMNWPSYGGLAGGVGMQILLPGARRQFSFFTDLLYHHFSSAGSSVVINNFTSESAALDFSQLQLNIQFRYCYPDGAVRPFLNVGLSNSLIINNKSTQTDHNSSLNTDSQGPIFRTSNGIKTYMVGLVAGGGIRAGRFSLEARIEKQESVSGLSDVNAPLTNFYLLAGFRL